MQMQLYVNTYPLDNGYYMRKYEWFEVGNPVKGVERHYDPQGRCIYTKEYDNQGNVYQTWRWYHNNGEIAGVSNDKGMIQRFNERGLPIK